MDNSYGVALLLEFEDAMAHDIYQDHADIYQDHTDHLRFIAECSK